MTDVEWIQILIANDDLQSDLFENKIDKGYIHVTERANDWIFIKMSPTVPSLIPQFINPESDFFT
ncbi:MAG: hypothetical protein ACTSPN_00855 [Promethearchaeota archaeon]